MPPKAVTSLTNERVKFVRSLEMRKTRRETGLFVAEGASIIATARDLGLAPRMLIYRAGSAEDGIGRQLVAWGLREQAECLEVSDAVLEKLAAKDNPQTMMAVFSQRFAAPPAPAEVAPGATWLALEEVRDPGNLGTIIRTADAVGAAGVILAGTCCDPYAREAVRATMGSIFAVPLVAMTGAAWLELARTWPGDVIGTHLAGREDFRAAAFRQPQLLVMGREGPGLSEATAAACTRLVKIPMAGRIDSLNLAIATALVLYQLRGGSLAM